MNSLWLSHGPNILTHSDFLIIVISISEAGSPLLSPIGVLSIINSYVFSRVLSIIDSEVFLTVLHILSINVFLPHLARKKSVKIV